MAKQRTTSEAAAREAQQALRALADAVQSGAKDRELPKKLRRALRDVEPLIERADRKLGKRQAKLMKAARKAREQRDAQQAKAAKAAKTDADPNATKAEKSKAKPSKPDAKAKASKPAKATAATPTAPGPHRQGPGSTPRTSVAGARARKRARRIA